MSEGTGILPGICLACAWHLPGKGISWISEACLEALHRVGKSDGVDIRRT